MIVIVHRIEPLPDRRTPTALAWVEVAGAVVGFTLRHQRRSAFTLAAPEAADRSPGVRLDDATLARVREAVEDAVYADPTVRKALARWWDPLPLRMKSGGQGGR